MRIKTWRSFPFPELVS